MLKTISNWLASHLETGLELADGFMLKYAPFVFFALVIAYIKYLLARDTQALRGVFKVVSTIILLAIALGMVLDQTNLGPVAKYAILGGTVLLFDSIILGLLSLGKVFQENPEKFIDKWLDKK